MTVTTSQPGASAQGYASGLRSFERFLVDGERHFGPLGADDRGHFAAFVQALPDDLRPAVESYFRGSVPRQPFALAAPASSEPSGSFGGVPDSVVREHGAPPAGRVGRVELLLEELMIDPCRTDRAGRRISIFLDVTAMDALGRLQTTTTKACLRRDCLPAAFCDTVLATVELGPFDDDVPRTVSFAVAAAEGTDDRLRELIEASRHYLRWDLDATREAGCAAPTGGILPQSRAALVASHTRAWLDCLLVWSGDVLPSLGKKAEARLGGEAQFTATIVGPELDYVYRNTSTGRLVEIIGSSRVRGRPMVQTFSSGDADLIGRFRMGFRTCLAAPALVAEKLPRALQEVGR